MFGYLCVRWRAGSGLGFSEMGHDVVGNIGVLCQKSVGSCVVSKYIIGIC